LVSIELKPDERIAHLVRTLSRGFSRCLQIRLVEYNVSFGHWTYLRILWETDGITQRELSRRLGVMEPTVHSALNKMQDADLVTRIQKDGDKKKNYVYLSNTGKSLRSKLEPMAVEVNNIAAEGLSLEMQNMLRQGLLHMSENLACDEQKSLEVGLSMPSTRQIGNIGDQS